MKERTEKKRLKKMLAISIIALLFSVSALIYFSFGWFNSTKELSTAVWIKTPIVLRIGSGNDRDIHFLDMGDIDVESNTSKDYVFCIYGSPVDNYSLQLAYTTNIDLKYTVYRAVETGVDTDVPSTYEEVVDGVKVKKTDYFARSTIKIDPVIVGLPITELTNPKEHQSHHLSYGDDKGENPVPTEMVQAFAEPLYWLAEEDGANVLKPLNIQNGSETQYFLDYFILHIEWGDNLKNDKETDIVYLTASR